MGRASGWWRRRDVPDLLQRLTRVAARYGLAQAGNLAMSPGLERVGAASTDASGREVVRYEVAFAQDSDEPDLCELARIEVVEDLRRRGIATCLYFALEDWLRVAGCTAVGTSANVEAALLCAKIGFDFDPARLPADIKKELALPRESGLRYPFEVARFQSAGKDGSSLLLRRGFTGKRRFDANPTLEAVAAARRAARGC